MQHTIAVFTHARAVDFNAEGVLRFSKTELHYDSYFKEPVRRFPFSDIDDRVMGAENHIESEYERRKMRDAVIELIDVLQSHQHGAPYGRNKYYDKGNGRIKEYEIEDQVLRGKLCEDECKRWRYLLERAEVIVYHVLDKYCKERQIRTVNDKNRSGILVSIIRKELTTLTRALSAVAAVGDNINMPFPIDFGDNLKDILKGVLDETNEEEQSHMKQKKVLEKKLNTVGKEVESVTGVKGENLLDEIKERLGSEHELVLTYVVQAASLVSEDYPKEKPSTKSSVEMNETIDAREKEMVVHLKSMATQLEQMFGEYQGRESRTQSKQVEQTIQNILKRITKELQYSTSSHRSELRWHIGRKNKSSEVKTLAEWCLKAESSFNPYVTQAIEFLVNRRMNIILLQVIQGEFDIQKIHQGSSISGDLKRLHEDTFENIPHLYVADENKQFIKGIERQFAEVYRKKLLLELEDNPSKKKERSNELQEFEKQLMQQKAVHESRVLDLTHILMNTVSYQAVDYTYRSQMKSQLMKMETKDYEDEVKLLSPIVMEEIPVEVKAYFDQKRIYDVTKCYLQFHCKMVAEMDAGFSARLKKGTKIDSSVMVPEYDIFALGKLCAFK